ncbi:DUF551 domain-containing protein [Acinetobacter baumannii]|uniref:DUF551 domain-containing protein n=1 Tax=Acinetobacter baumannii TaxID=470 RepID=A0A6B2IIK4_ACIBA|nr:DUF551 domain-containing protein [Acinetobacter baumannii]EJB8458435.1 DUF551 domain-containing protein [Acinetobacter baumannii]EKT8422343.1 DUF551 domain-containing protein [Acinetobacter baumannii]EKT8512134.1 DUF551 domain-containing protein [Acinetobacter baumannii]EKT8592905.1 DUF551 domain-containing protein [Acinetobacter baumannii]EKT8646440.1 DUF551 domain-containing protein [Acinetobacter baumannii]
MFNEDEEKLAHEIWYKNNDPIAYKFYRDLSPEFETDFYTSETAWLARAKAQAVQQSFEIGRLQDRITELLDERQDLYAQINNDQAVPTWISVKDEEPPTDTMVLICWSDSPDVQPEIDYMTCDEDLNHIWANFYKDPPTHWMHFHKVPSESGAEG